MLWVIFLSVAFGSSPSLAQTIPAERPRSRPPSELTGWADWEKANELLQRIQVPPAPPLNPQEALKTFRVAPGYRLELVAAEPMVQNPIFFEFDPDGRIWVVEYQGYMRDLLGTGEGDPICRVVVLEDGNEDGRADKSTVFLDRLVMPRSLAFVKGGVLIAEPPKLWFCQDTNADLRCDSKVQVGTYGRAGNPQHTANGLRYGLDNWLHSSDWPARHRFVDGQLIEEPAIHRGQFGVTFDDAGRFMTCYESSALHADLIPAEYLLRNKNFLKAYQRGGRDRGDFGVNANIARAAQEIFPIRVTPQITLGALELREDGRLRTYTVVSGTCYYNGDQFPADAHGNVFVPDAGGHLIGRLRLSGDIAPQAARFYPAEQEFLASTDERFRPVNARVGPDGALYVADMYHGIIEHVIFMVPYLEKQVKERHLDDGLDMGRIYRVVHEGKPINRKRPKLSAASSLELASLLGHSNAWWRLTAQRLLAERADGRAIPALEKTALRGINPLARQHALWTLEGMDALDVKSALKALDDKNETVRATAVRLGEQLIARPNTSTSSDQTARQFLGRLTRMEKDPSRAVRLQILLTAGAFPGEQSEKIRARLVSNNEHGLFRAAAMTGLQSRELEFLSRLLSLRDWQTLSDHQRRMIAWLAQAVVDEAAPDRIERLLDQLATDRSELRDALCDGLLAGVPRDLQGIQPISLQQQPVILTKLARSSDPALRERAFRLHAFFTWPGAPALRPGITDTQPLTAEQKRLAELGEQQYAALCAACHQPHGGGLAGVAPPLSRSEWVTGSSERLARIVLHGLYGPVEVSGQKWDLHMPSFGPVLDDEKLAGILTFIRRAWDNAAEPIAPSLVAEVRRQTESRALPWTVQELAEPPGKDGFHSVPDRQNPLRTEFRDAVQRAHSNLIKARFPEIIRPDEKGEFRLSARFAVTHGRELAYRPSLDILAPWRREQDVAEWRVEIPTAGTYEVWVELAADDASAGDKFAIETEGGRLIAAVQSSGGYDRFREYVCGQIALRAGINRVLMRPEGPLKRELADVRALRFAPIKRR